LDDEKKKDIKNRWNKGELNIVVTTTKFRYGILSNNSKLIIHEALPTRLD